MVLMLGNPFDGGGDGRNGYGRPPAGKEERKMKKILLDFTITETPEQVQDYLALELGFPDSYGKNLDALYDMLTEPGGDTCIAIFEPGSQRRIDAYLRRVKRVFKDAEQENPHLCVFFGNLEENYEEDEGRAL